MSNKEFNKKFDEILKELFEKKITSFDSMFNNIQLDELGENIGNGWKKFMNTSKDGLFKSVLYVFNPLDDVDTSTDSFRKTKHPQKKMIDALKKELEDCVKVQNFERAAELRDEINKLSETKSRIVELQKELEKVIQDQNFERAIEIRDELKTLN